MKWSDLRLSDSLLIKPVPSIGDVHQRGTVGMHTRDGVRCWIREVNVLFENGTLGTRTSYCSKILAAQVSPWFDRFVQKRLLPDSDG